MADVLWLWMREDGHAPKVVGVGVRPPGPGAVLEVLARSKAEALRVVQQRRAIERVHGRPLSEERAEILALEHATDHLYLRALAVREVPASEQLRAHGAGE